ncbi:hypothetical protein AWB81_01829 [Caballeronia arationis]|uniref:hypothetical protein n=1 Tax=Caballeronia arationis TaxID=1777142 RepID=UPI00074CB700|nr:hypothetical protein [Caballeronia arationis]SAK59348.1 hypothetical protein AWB81_01829 [Caballeronia arationis]
MKSRESEKTLVTLANATTLVRTIVQGVLGNDAADTFGGAPLTTDVINQIAQAKFQAAVQPYL